MSLNFDICDQGVLVLLALVSGDNRFTASPI